MIKKVTKTLWYAVDIDGSGWLHEAYPRYCDRRMG